MKTLADRLTSKLAVNEDTGCLEFQGYRDKGGYGQVGRATSSKYAHRIAYELEYGPIPEGARVLHHCCNPSCCNPEHLFLGDPMAYKVARGTQSKQGRPRKVTREIYERILKLRKHGLSNEAIADRFGISLSTLSNYVGNGKDSKKWSNP